MKKLLILLAVVFYSCDRIAEQDTVKSVTEFKKGNFRVETSQYSFITCSAYRVGDTIVLRKK